MDISQMRTVLAIAECGSMTVTAKKLRVTQPALTYQIKVVENELGVKMFNRSHNGTTLTAEGVFLYDTMKKIVSEYDEAARLARAMARDTATDSLRIGIDESSRDTISFLLNVARSSLPLTLIPCGSSDPVALLQDHVIDAWSTSDVACSRPDANLRFMKLASVGQSAFVPLDHELATRDSICTDDLRGGIVWLWPKGRTSRSADLLREKLEMGGTIVEDFVPGVAAIVNTFAADGIAVYDDGFLPPPSSQAARVPLSDAADDVLGLAYLESQEKRIAPALENIAERAPENGNRQGSPSELVAERIVALLDDISSTVRRAGMKDIVPLVEYGLELGISANHLLNRGLLVGMKAASGAYDRGEIYTTEMLTSVATANMAMEVLQPYLADLDTKRPRGSAVIGTVLGDRHDIGKNLVRIMLESRDIEVTDLGRQVAPNAFVEHIRNSPDCNVVLVSVSRTELLDNVRAVVEALEEAGLREQAFIMVGGYAASQEFADEIGADAYTQSAEDAAEKAHGFMSLG